MYIFLMAENPLFGGAYFSVAEELSEMAWQVGLVLGVAALLYIAALHVEPPEGAPRVDRQAERAEPSSSEP